MANENLKKQMVVKLGTTTNTEAQLISNMVDGALSGKGGNDPELENLKKQMVIKLGTTTNEDAQIISNMVDNAAGGGGGGSNIPICKVTLQNTSPSSGNISIRLADNQFVLNENGTLAIEKVYNIGPNPGTTTIDFLISEQQNPQSSEIIHSACTGMLLHGASEDYSDLISNLNNVSIMSVQLGDNNYGYAAIVLDITKPASLTYKTGFGIV